MKLGDKLARQNHIAAVAPKSPVFSALVESTLAAWSANSAEVATTLAELSAARAQLMMLHQKLEQLAKLFDELAQKYRSAAHLASGGDILDLLSLGVAAPLKAVKTVVVVGPPTNVQITAGKYAGQIVLGYSPVKGAQEYVLQQSFEPVSATSWTAVQGKIHRRRVVVGLPPGQHMQFRMASVNGAGQSAWSEPVGFLIR
jgi:hypothetical protein